MDLKQDVCKWLEGKVDAVGFAPVGRFDQAPENHHPRRVVKDAGTVIVLGKAVPRGMLSSPGYNLYALHRTYHTVYTYLDELTLNLSVFIESRGDHLAVPIPTFAPLVYNRMEPWGVISLKHAAQKAGLGSFGRTGLLYHPKYGSLLRLAAVVTSAEIPGDTQETVDPCPPGCELCVKACPKKALEKDGAFEKMVCLAHSVKHAIYPMALKDKKGLEKIELVINTAGYNYWLACDQCLIVCPNNKKKKASK